MITSKERQSLNVSVVVLFGYEMKVTVLVDWAIDAPVGNNLGILALWQERSRREMPTTSFAVMSRNRL